ncbi:MAG: hypothetical protein ACRCR3_10115 [Tannerellaceae bacterium]
MCTYAEIENVVLSNGKTVKQVNEDVSKEISDHTYGWFDTFFADAFQSLKVD